MLIKYIFCSSEIALELNNPHFQVLVSDDGNVCCRACMELGSCKRFIARVSQFVHSMDEARLLYARTFSPETVDDLIEQLRGSPNYLRRHKNAYEMSFGMPLEKLHRHVRSVWLGRQSNKLTDTLTMWVSQYVTPALEVEPGASIEEVHVQKLLNYISMSKVQKVNRQELKLVERIVTGKISQHPAIQGMLIACMNKLQCQERGTCTVRDRHRDFS